MENLVIQIEQSKIDIPTLKINNYYIHSKYNPLKEAENFALKNYKKGSFHVVFGGGLGYYTNAFNNLSGDGQDILVIDPITDLNHDEKVHLDFSDNVLNNLIRDKLVGWTEIKLICLPNYSKLFPTYYLKVARIVRDKMLIKQIFENTINQHSDIWQENYIRNLEFLNKDKRIDDLKNKVDYPIIIASGGPSLTKQLDLMKQYRQKYILIAAGSTVTSLMKNDLEPDFVVVMDGKESNYKLFEDLKFTKAKLIYGLVTRYKIRKYFNQDAYHYLSTDCYMMEDHYIELTGNQATKLAGGGSVATFALSFARFLSSGPITMVGQDLAYTNNLSHNATNKNVFQITEHFIKDRNLFEIEGYNGEKVLTGHNFLAMKEVFEIIYNDLENKGAIYNSTEGGVNIVGYQNMRLEDFTKRFLNLEIDMSIFDMDSNLKYTHNKILMKLMNEVAAYEEGIKLLLDNIKLLNSTRSKRKFNSSILRRMDLNDGAFKILCNKVSVNLSAHKIVTNVLNGFKPAEFETENIKYNRIYNQNDELLNQLLELFIKAKRMTEDVVNNLKETS
ncbi:motility associated factor glycosyltransferase family protein [Psychrobacillus sp. NPDC096623]|uniref:motility associated factor glycosyltransferase family protein n=1 Tax=Psychrobacillus sp. NPDC096623 TaxID=3364492 RepID=UPI003803261A